MFNKLKKFLKSKRAVGSVATAIKVGTAVVLGVTILIGGALLTKDVILPNTSSKLSNIADYEGEVSVGGVIPVSPSSSVDIKSIQGTEILALNDVSDNPHSLGVSLSNDDINDFSDITISRYGKNLLDATTFLASTNVSITNKELGVVTFTKKYSPASNGIIATVDLPAGSYCFSFNVEISDESYSKTNMSASVTNKTTNAYILAAHSGTTHKFTLSEATSCKIMIYSPYGAPVNTSINVYDIQLEYGNSKTDYEPYVEPQTVTANTDGTVNGLTSISPNLTLITESSNTVISCEYQKKNILMPLSINKVSVTNGDFITLENNILKKDQTYHFTADVTSYSSIKIYHGADIFSGGYIEITNSDIKAYIYTNSYELKTSVSHGLTISKNIDITIHVNTFGKATVSVTSNGDSFTSEQISWGACRGEIKSEIVDCELSNANFMWTTTEYEKNIWVFGDSWMSLSTDGWTHYLLEEKDNFSISGYGGGISPYLYNAFVTGLKHDVPQYAVWALGMNEGDSSEGVLNATWKEYLDKFLNQCQIHGITPILVTIPSSVSINNDVKNNYIKNSGYRYIDFADAVGGDEYGTAWSSGLSKSDGNHPNSSGAVVLANRVKEDFPEILTIL